MSDVDLSSVLPAVAAEYPALAPHTSNAVVQWGPPQSAVEGGQLETYPPWESENPNPGRTTLEFYNRNLSMPEIHKAAAADMLHIIGATDPRNGQDIDPRWMAMKRQFQQSMTADQLNNDSLAYNRAKGQGEERSFNDWHQDSRTEAYLRGYMFPDAADEWRKSGTYTPQQEEIMARMHAHLKGEAPQSMGDAVGRALKKPGAR